jgi:glycosyltransferase involved in cell wall biosynthesis
MFLEPRMGGIDTYVKALVPTMARLAPDTHFTVYCSPGGREYLEADAGFIGLELVVPPLFGRRGLKALGELTALGVIAGRNVDLLHSVALTAPLWTHAVNVVTLADVTWIVAADPGERWTIRLWRVVVPPVARRADRIIVHSKAAANDVVEHLHVPAERIDVIAHGRGFVEIAPPTGEAELRARLGLGDGPIVLTVSAKKIHKNLERLVRAMVAVLERWPDAVLVMPGNPTPHEQVLIELASELGIAQSVVFPAYVDARDLEGLYAAAGCFVFASINEGFGIPILEAMERGVPVACSRASALPEVAGDAARYFDPLSVGDIADAVCELLGDQQFAAELVERGRARAAGFTWEKAARGTLQSYARAWSERG